MTQDINIAFSRALLREATKELKDKAPAIRVMKDAWVLCAGRDHWEFHGPAIRQNAHSREEYYWHGHADNAYEARYKGWMAWLEAKEASRS